MQYHVMLSTKLVGYFALGKEAFYFLYLHDRWFSYLICASCGLLQMPPQYWLLVIFWLQYSLRFWWPKSVASVNKILYGLTSTPLVWSLTLLSSVAFLTVKGWGACKTEEYPLHSYAKLRFSASAPSGPLLFTVFHFFTSHFGMCNWPQF